MTDSLARKLWRALSWPLVFLAAIIIVFEEYAWDELSQVLAWVARWPPLAWLERGIARLPPAGALALFIVPFLVVEPIKIAALYLMSQGHALLGLLVILAVKIVGTAVLARLFALTKPALLRVGWFARFYHWFQGFRERVFARLHASAPWRAAHALAQAWRERAQGLPSWLRLGRRMARQWRREEKK